MKYSIKKQFAIVFITLMTVTLLVCWFINNMFLDRYYIEKKTAAIRDVYLTINKEATSGNMWSEEFDIRLQKIIEKYNINIIVLDADSKTLKTSMNDPDTMSKRLWDNFFGDSTFQKDKTLLEEKESYTIQIMADQRTGTEYLEMWGVLDNSNIFLIRSALEGIQDSVTIANRFLAYVGAVAVLVSGCIIIFVSSKITDPILELADISERMRHLDFNAKYTGRNKTEIALLGENINELSITLEKTISELKTANHELKRDIEKKIEIDEMRKEFISNVSHELKTPIALIQGYAEGLKESILDDPESKEFYCDVIMDEAVKMNMMVKKLLNLNQLESGNDTVSFERFDLAAMIRSYIQSADILVKQKDVNIKVESFEPVFVWSDEFKTEEVFMNYFTNALNHVSNEKVIEIKWVRREDKIRVSVFNTGAPIPVECIEHIWEKFYKVDKARTREYGGSGVGLSIVKAIMESFNQDFGVNNFDNGVEFWFELDAA